MYKQRAAIKKACEKIIKTRYSDAHQVWLEGQTRLLCSLRRLFGNDLDKAIILSVIGERWFKYGVSDSYGLLETPATVLKVDVGGLVNVESISSSTGIPRESVRRKVEELIRDGLVMRVGRGRIRPCSQIAIDLHDSIEIEIENMSNLFAHLAIIAQDEDALIVRIIDHQNSEKTED